MACVSQKVTSFADTDAAADYTNIHLRGCVPLFNLAGMFFCARVRRGGRISFHRRVADYLLYEGHRVTLAGLSRDITGHGARAHGLNTP